MNKFEQVTWDPTENRLTDRHDWRHYHPATLSSIFYAAQNHQSTDILKAVSSRGILCLSLSHFSLSHNGFFLNYQLSKENLSLKTDNICIDCLYQQYQTMKGAKKCFQLNWAKMTKIVVVIIVVILPQFYTFLSTFHSLVLLIKTINTYMLSVFGLRFSFVNW